MVRFTVFLLVMSWSIIGSAQTLDPRFVTPVPGSVGKCGPGCTCGPNCPCTAAKECLTKGVCKHRVIVLSIDYCKACDTQFFEVVKLAKKGYVCGDAIGNHFQFMSATNDAEGIRIAAKYRVRSYPTSLLLDRDGNVLDRRGYLSADDLEAWFMGYVNSKGGGCYGPSCPFAVKPVAKQAAGCATCGQQRGGRRRGR